VGFPLARCLGSFESQHALCRGGCGGLMSFWLPPVFRGPWIPAFAGKTKIILPRAAPFRFPRESGGPGTAMMLLSWNGPQRSGRSAGTMFELISLSLKSQPAPCCGALDDSMSFWLPPVFRGPWLPAFAGKTMRVGKREAQEPRWGRCHGVGLSAASLLLCSVRKSLDSGARRVAKSPAAVNQPSSRGPGGPG